MRRVLAALALASLCNLSSAGASQAASPEPLVKSGAPATWWFAYKFWVQDIASSAGDPPADCKFGGSINPGGFSQRYVVASSNDPLLKDGPGLIGKGDNDPLGATFGAIFHGDFNYVVWNDQFYGSPVFHHPQCSTSDRQNNCMSPWGHAKGMMAWNTAGDGVVIQVTTPDWPGSASQNHPRVVSSTYPKGKGNTLGCVANNNVIYAQHFFALKLSADDVKQVLRALDRASVATLTNSAQLVGTTAGGTNLPADVQQLVDKLQKTHPSTATAPFDVTLSSGVRLIAKPSDFNAPPWQFVSWRLGAADLRVATWNNPPTIPSTYDEKKVGCWPAAYRSAGQVPHIGRVESATTGRWGPTTLHLRSSQNHGKFGVSRDAGGTLSIFGDLNQSGNLTGSCGLGQNGRGGLFFVVDDAQLATSIRSLLDGDSEPYTP
jgi:hypothetical protein